MHPFRVETGVMVPQGGFRFNNRLNTTVKSVFGGLGDG